MEGKLFSPLAWTKSFILIDAFFSYYTDPVLISYLLKGKLVQRIRIQSIEKWKVGINSNFLFKMEKSILLVNCIALLIGGLMYTRLGSEFMPPLDEGSILFMPVTLPDVSNSEVKEYCRFRTR
jgi:Cu(I)/Ag(I) efflux system membrane protein CusA/SilA